MHRRTRSGQIVGIVLLIIATSLGQSSFAGEMPIVRTDKDIYRDGDIIIAVAGWRLVLYHVPHGEGAGSISSNKLTLLKKN